VSRYRSPPSEEDQRAGGPGGYPLVVPSAGGPPPHRRRRPGQDPFAQGQRAAGRTHASPGRLTSTKSSTIRASSSGGLAPQALVPVISRRGLLVGEQQAAHRVTATRTVDSPCRRHVPCGAAHRGRTCSSRRTGRGPRCRPAPRRSPAWCSRAPRLSGWRTGSGSRSAGSGPAVRAPGEAAPAGTRRSGGSASVTTPSTSAWLACRMARFCLVRLRVHHAHEAQPVVPADLGDCRCRGCPSWTSTTTDRPGTISPSRIFAWSMVSAERALTLPPGLNFSILANSLTVPSRASFFQLHQGRCRRWWRGCPALPACHRRLPRSARRRAPARGRVPASSHERPPG